MKYVWLHLKLLLVFSLLLENSNAALNFAGTSQVYNVSSGAPDMNSPFTIGGWIRRDYSNNTKDGAFIARQTGDATPSCSEFILRWHNDFIQVLDNYGVFANLILQSSGTITDFNWHDVLVTRNGSTWKLYVDGSLNNTSVFVFANNTGCNFSISYGVGGNTCGQGDLGACFMADWAMFNSVLPTQLIDAHAKGTPWSLVTKPLFYWRMDHANSTVPDLSGNGWHMTAALTGNDQNAFHCPCGMPTGEGH